jgi:hypothetical protein
MITKILDIVNWVRTLDKKVIAFIGGAILVLFMMQQCNRISELKTEIKQVEAQAENNLNNYIAANDSIKYFRTLNGDMVAQISSYQFTVDDLQRANGNLLKKYRRSLLLNKELEGVKNLLESELQIKDSIIASTSSTRLSDSTDLIEFKDYVDYGDGNSRDLSGSLVVTKLDSALAASDVKIRLIQSITLRAAVEEVDGRDQIKISTGYPGLTIGSIENINLINNKLNAAPYSKKAGWSVGIGVGYGVMLNNGQQLGFGPTIGAHLIWSPKWLRF